jgi:hypothetical protein
MLLLFHSPSRLFITHFLLNGIWNVLASFFHISYFPFLFHLFLCLSNFVLEFRNSFLSLASQLHFYKAHWLKLIATFVTSFLFLSLLLILGNISILNKRRHTCQSSNTWVRTPTLFALLIFQIESHTSS